MKRSIPPLLLGVALLAAGCASLNAVDSDVSSYGAWPADRLPGTYAFERLPSQQAQAVRQQQLEQAAAPALERAGFKPAPDGAKPDVIVQIGARIDRNDRSPWDDPLWWHGYGRFYAVGWQGPWFGTVWRPWAPLDNTHYEREVALLIRDAADGKPLFEAHADTGGITQGSDALIGAMFAATLAEFPKSENKVHTVRTMLAPR